MPTNPMYTRKVFFAILFKLAKNQQEKIQELVKRDTRYRDLVH